MKVMPKGTYGPRALRLREVTSMNTPPEAVTRPDKVSKMQRGGHSPNCVSLFWILDSQPIQNPKSKMRCSCLSIAESACLAQREPTRYVLFGYQIPVVGPGK